MGNSDHLPAVLLVQTRAMRDGRLLPPLDKHAFKSERYYKILARRVKIAACDSTAVARSQLEVFKTVVQEVAGQQEDWSSLA